MKLNFTPVCNFSFKSVHCVMLYGEYHMFAYGDYKCYSWWQILILTCLIPALLLFPVAFEMSLRMLKERKISTNMMIFNLLLPYSSVFLYIQKKKNKSIATTSHDDVEEEFCTESILGVEWEVLKKTNYLISWRAVQLYRSIIIVAVRTFVIKPVYINPVAEETSF